MSLRDHRLWWPFSSVNLSQESKHIKSSRQGGKHQALERKTCTHSCSLPSPRGPGLVYPSLHMSFRFRARTCHSLTPKEPETYHWTPLSCSTQGPTLPPKSWLNLYLLLHIRYYCYSDFPPKTVRFFKGKIVSYLTCTELKQSWKYQ